MYLDLPSIYFLDFVLIFVYLSQIPITLKKEPEIDSNGQEVLKCGFKIGGGIDQDYQKSPQGYADNVSASLYYCQFDYFVTFGRLSGSKVHFCGKFPLTF